MDNILGLLKTSYLLLWAQYTGSHVAVWLQLQLSWELIPGLSAFYYIAPTWNRAPLPHCLQREPWLESRRDSQNLPSIGVSPEKLRSSLWRNWNREIRAEESLPDRSRELGATSVTTYLAFNHHCQVDKRCQQSHLPPGVLNPVDEWRKGRQSPGGTVGETAGTKSFCTPNSCRPPERAHALFST